MGLYYKGQTTVTGSLVFFLLNSEYRLRSHCSLRCPFCLAACGAVLAREKFQKSSPFCV